MTPSKSVMFKALQELFHTARNMDIDKVLSLLEKDPAMGVSGYFRGEARYCEECKVKLDYVCWKRTTVVRGMNRVEKVCGACVVGTGPDMRMEVIACKSTLQDVHKFWKSMVLVDGSHTDSTDVVVEPTVSIGFVWKDGHDQTFSREELWGHPDGAFQDLFSTDLRMELPTVEDLMGKSSGKRRTTGQYYAINWMATDGVISELLEKWRGEEWWPDLECVNKYGSNLCLVGSAGHTTGFHLDWTEAFNVAFALVDVGTWKPLAGWKDIEEGTLAVWFFIHPDGIKDASEWVISKLGKVAGFKGKESLVMTKQQFE
jgi:hypothetical protein